MWRYHPDFLTGVARHMPPAEESRKFDIHACEAGMNIKFPGFSCGLTTEIPKEPIWNYWLKVYNSAGFDTFFHKEHV
jgi:hypothetical protein